jgi:hypothetical protein
MAVGRLTSPSNKQIAAITNNTWINTPTVVRKKPIAQTITSTTAMIYSNEFMIDFFNDFG